LSTIVATLLLKHALIRSDIVPMPWKKTPLSDKSINYVNEEKKGKDNLQ